MSKTRYETLYELPNLRAHREARYWSMTALAAEAGVNTKTISNIESKGMAVRGSTLTKIATALGVKPEELRGVDGQGMAS